MKKADPTPDPRRRALLAGAAAAPLAAGAAGAARAGLPTPATPEAPAATEPSGYHETAHIRRYYAQLRRM